jgi:hypothetical protein
LAYEVAWRMGIRIDDKPCTCGSSYACDMAIGDVVASACCELQSNAVRYGESRFLFRNEARVGQDVHVWALDGSAVSSWRHRFHWGLAVYDNQGSAEIACVPGQLWDLGWWYMSEFHTRDEGYREPVGIFAGEPCELSNQAVQIGAVGVIGNG